MRYLRPKFSPSLGNSVFTYLLISADNAYPWCAHTGLSWQPVPPTAGRRLVNSLPRLELPAPTWELNTSPFLDVVYSWVSSTCSLARLPCLWSISEHDAMMKDTKLSRGCCYLVAQKECPPNHVCQQTRLSCLRT